MVVVEVEVEVVLVEVLDVVGVVVEDVDDGVVVEDVVVGVDVVVAVCWRQSLPASWAIVNAP